MTLFITYIFLAFLIIFIITILFCIWQK